MVNINKATQATRAHQHNPPEEPHATLEQISLVLSKTEVCNEATQATEPFVLAPLVKPHAIPTVLL